MEEIWKDIEGYEGLYQVSNLGRVKSFLKNKYVGAIRAFATDKDGYFTIVLHKPGQKYNKKVHRLVATAFIPNPLNKPCIDHINTNRKDNRVDNLRWCTVKENAGNPLTRAHISTAKTGTKASEDTKKLFSMIRQGALNPMYGRRHSMETKQKLSKPIVQLDVDGNIINEFMGAQHASDITGIHRQTIVGVLNGRGYTAGGYKWKYKED